MRSWVKEAAGDEEDGRWGGRAMRRTGDEEDGREANRECLMTELIEKDLLLSKNTLPLLVRIGEQ